MPIVQVSSSNIKGYRYIPHQRLLDIQFQNNSIYRYYDVPRKTAEEFMDAKSFGKIFNTTIKNGFKFRKVSS